MSRVFRSCLNWVPLVLGIVISMSVFAQEAIPNAKDSLSVEFVNEPLGNVLQILSSISGTEIELVGPVADQRISTILTGITLTKGLALVLNDISHTLIWRSDGGITVMALGASEVVPVLESAAESTTSDVSLDMPPDLGDGTGGMHRPSTFYADNPDVELLPPENPGQKGLTRAEFEDQRSQRKQLSPSEYEILPPDEPGGRGLTLAEFNQQRSLKSGQKTPAGTVLPD